MLLSIFPLGMRSRATPHAFVADDKNLRRAGFCPAGEDDTSPPGQNLSCGGCYGFCRLVASGGGRGFAGFRCRPRPAGGMAQRRAGGVCLACRGRLPAARRGTGIGRRPAGLSARDLSGMNDDGAALGGACREPPARPVLVGGALSLAGSAPFLGICSRPLYRRNSATARGRRPSCRAETPAGGAAPASGADRRG